MEGGLAGAQSALAHAVLVESRPAQGARLLAPPEEIRLRFNEPVQLLALRLLDAHGQERAHELRSAPSGDELVFAPGSPLDPGLYTVSWRIVSADGHPVGGSLRFALGIDPVPAEPVEVAPAQHPLLAVGVRTLLLVSVFAAVGLTVGRVWLADGLPAATVRASERSIVLFASLAGASALAHAFTTGMALSDGEGLGVLATLSGGLAAPAGVSALVAAIGVLVGTSALFLGPGGPGALLAAAAATGGAAALGFAGHATVAPPRAVGTAALAVHLVVAALWFGALLILRSAARFLEPEPLAALLRRFSRVALPSVVVLLGCGLVLASRQLVSLADFKDTVYGAILGVKLLALAGVLAIAVHNRFVLTPALARGVVRARPRLARNLALELGGLVIVVALASALTTTPPPRALAQAQAAAPRTQLLEAQDEAGRRVRITLNPARPGWNRYEVVLSDPRGAPLVPLEAELVVESPARGIEPVRIRLQREGERWVHAGTELSLPGSWQLAVDVLLDPFTRARFATGLVLE